MRSEEFGRAEAEGGPGVAVQSVGDWGHVGPAPGLTSGSSTADDPVAQARVWLAERGLAVPSAEAEPPALARPRLPAGPPVREDERPLRGADATVSGEADADPESVARTIVLRKLAAQARTRAELEKALQAKLVPAEAAKSVLDRMEAVGLVDDEEFARDWVASRQQRRYLSKSALRRELNGKGVPREEIDLALESVDQDAELSAARALVTRKVRAMAELDHQVRYRRLAGMLGRRGFSPGVVSRVLNDMLLADGDT